MIKAFYPLAAESTGWCFPVTNYDIWIPFEHHLRLASYNIKASN